MIRQEKKRGKEEGEEKEECWAKDGDRLGKGGEGDRARGAQPCEGWAGYSRVHKVGSIWRCHRLEELNTLDKVRQLSWSGNACYLEAAVSLELGPAPNAGDGGGGCYWPRHQHTVGAQQLFTE